MRTLFAELKKSRRRHNLLVAVCISLFVLLWATQTGGTGEGRLEQGYSGLFYAVPVMNTVVMPLGTAVLASRLWDLETKANTVAWERDERKTWYVLFSASGFTEELELEAEARTDVQLCEG